MNDEVEAEAVAARLSADEKRQAELRAMRAARSEARAASIAGRYARALRAALGLEVEALTWYGQAPIDAWRSGDVRFRRFLHDHAPPEV